MLDARAIKSQQAILSTALPLFNLNKEVTFSEIANKARIGRATLYRQYETREALVKALAGECLKRLNAANDRIEKEAKSAIHAIELSFRYITPFTEELKFLVTAESMLEDDPELKAIYQKQFDEMIELVKLAKIEGSIRKSLPDEWVATYIDGLFFIAWEAINRQGMSPEQAATLAFDSLCSGVS